MAFSRVSLWILPDATSPTGGLSIVRTAYPG